MISVKQYDLLVNLCKNKLNKIDHEYDHIITWSAKLIAEKIVEIYPQKSVSYTHIANIVNDMVKTNKFDKKMVKTYQECTFAMTVGMLTAFYDFEISFEEFPSIKLIYNADRFCNIVNNWNPQSRIRYFKNKSEAINYAKSVYKYWKPVYDYNTKFIPKLTGYISIPLSNIGNNYLANSLGSDFIETSSKRKLGSSMDYWISQRTSYIKYLTDKNIALTPENIIVNMLEYGWKRPRFTPVNLICDFIIRTKSTGRLLDISNNLPAVIAAALVTKCKEVTHLSTVDNYNKDCVEKVKESFPDFKITTRNTGVYDMGIMYCGKIDNEYKNYNHWKKTKFLPDIKKVNKCRNILIFAEDGYNAHRNKQIVHHIWNYFKNCKRKIFGLLIPKILRTKKGDQFKSFKNIVTTILIENHY